jgi:hypothetical protein
MDLVQAVCLKQIFGAIVPSLGELASKSAQSVTEISKKKSERLFPAGFRPFFLEDKLVCCCGCDVAGSLPKFAFWVEKSEPRCFAHRSIQFYKFLSKGIRQFAASIPEMKRVGTRPGADSCFETHHFDWHCGIWWRIQEKSRTSGRKPGFLRSNNCQYLRRAHTPPKIPQEHMKQG